MLPPPTVVAPEPPELPDDAVAPVDEPAGVEITPQLAAPNATHSTPPTSTIRVAPRAGRAAASPMRFVPATFMASVAVTLVAVVVPWFAVISPRLHAAIDARPTPPDPVVVEVPVPYLVTPPAPDPVDPEPTVEVAARPAAAAPRPSPPPAPVPAPLPPPPPAAPEPAPTPEAAPVAPEAARQLNGRYAGTVGGKPLFVALSFEPAGRLVATIQRGPEAPLEAVGRYTLSGDRATLAFVEPVEGGASYSGTVSPSGLSGRIAYPTGKTQRFSVSR